MAYFERLRHDPSRRHAPSDSPTAAESLSLLASRPPLRPTFPKKWNFTNYRSSILFNKVYLGAVAVAVCLLIVWLLLDVKINVQIHRPCVNGSNSSFSNYSSGWLNGFDDLNNDISSNEWKNYSYYMNRLPALSSSVMKPRTYKLTIAPPFPFSQYSSYRMNENAFVSVGFGYKPFSVYDLISKDCWWVEYNGKVISGKVKVFKIEEEFNGPSEYATIIFHCVLEKATKFHGGSAHVMIGRQDFSFYEEKIGKKHIIRAPRDEKLPFFISSCISPETEPLEGRIIVEFIEYHSHMGVSHFSMYDGGFFDADLAALLEEYLSANVLEIIPFRDIQQYGLFSSARYISLHDCLYHSIMKSRWVMTSELDEYLHIPPPSSLFSLLVEKNDRSFLTHGTQVWSVMMCRTGPPVFGSDKWTPHGTSLPMAIERMVFRWPHVVCHGGTQEDDFNVCLGGRGWRRYIYNPRQAYLLGLWEVIGFEGGEGEDLNFQMAHHHKFTSLQLKANFSQACDSVFGDTEKTEWWVRDVSFASFTKELRQSVIPTQPKH